MTDPDFPCSVTITVPLLTHRLASTAQRSLSVDAELSTLVRRAFSLTSQHEGAINGNRPFSSPEEDMTVLKVDYKATTNRMLRVAVNGFMESLGVVLYVMEGLDVDVLAGGL